MNNNFDHNSRRYAAITLPESSVIARIIGLLIVVLIIHAGPVV